MLNVFRQIRRLMALCLAAPGNKTSLLLFAVVVALNLGSVYATLRLVQWTGEIYSAVEKVNAS